MCGITGYVGRRPAVETALSNLKRLEYRGYDSAGVAYSSRNRLRIVRATGRIANLERVLQQGQHEASVAIAHTRWATHGVPAQHNAHPHPDCTGRIAVVHNGIIENYALLRDELQAQGHRFASETDTEVIAHLIERELATPGSMHGDPAECVAAAVRRAAAFLRGAYALAVIAQDVPDTIWVARKDSPLVIGIGEGEHFLASDIPAVMRYTRSILLLEDGDFAVLRPDSVRVTNALGRLQERSPLQVTWDDAAAEKGGYPHFMLKEIFEGARTVQDTLRGRLSEVSAEEGSWVHLPELGLTEQQWARFQRVVIVGCGTAYHAGVVGKRMFEQLLRRPAEVAVASEFRYSDPLVDAQTLVVLISQSGETADTLAAMREAKARGATTLAIVNVVGSTLAREADATLITQAGPEIGVASTKAYLAQLTALALLGVHCAEIEMRRKSREGDETAVEIYHSLVQALRTLPEQVATCLQREASVAAIAQELATHRCFFYLGRGYDLAVALEAALKLKEVSYIHAEAYPAGEMKHGPLALVEPGVAVVGLCTQQATQEKMISNLKEVKARRGTVIAVLRDEAVPPDCADHVIRVPSTLDMLMPVVAMVPMQLLAYHVARVRGCEIDHPRNLAKSVTVE
ncbi:MAG: glutamine--fructose-6-phosphate transaminase (isomerizing) [Chloroherpetonaceae bacterium]|nr:glutamine--fructose-6-phosphate transaminase (isomerizing) [Chthonomonadaceae bacterium]MDW8207401.1 glutamine--fructose-6-phosphate transaminase (isomerizing) [Chloroherpetonaceae bacterium]